MGNLNAMIIIYRDRDQLSQAAAQFFQQVVREAAEQRGQALVALSGGSTPRQLFALLACAPFAEQIPWQAVHFFWADERCVPPDHPESNFGQANLALFQPLNLPAANLHRIQGEIAPDQAALAYAHTLRQYAVPGQAWPVFDLVLLGLGADGHTASLFPGESRALQSPVLAVTADYQDRPARRVTLTPLVFNSARRVLFLVTGEDKADAVRRTVFDTDDPHPGPAKLIAPAQGTLSWFLDAGAARGLSGEHFNFSARRS
jgi:6-phosphogluconolactonase